MDIRRLVVMSGLLVAGLLLAPRPGHAQSLPPEAQAAVDRGLGDAQRQDFKAATDEFLAAWRLAPNDPRIYFDLGLAESNRPGFELRAMAWFDLYLLKQPFAPDAGAVRSQVAALDAGLKARLSAVADKFETILMLVKDDPRGWPSQKEADAASRFELWTGWQIATIRFTIGDVPGGWKTLRRTDGDQWRKAWDEDQRTTGSPMNRDLEESIASAGLLDQAFDMLRHDMFGDIDGYFQEQRDIARALQLPNYPKTDPLVHVCSPDELAYDAAKFRTPDYAKPDKCSDALWWSTGREAALLMYAVNGVHLDGDYDDTQFVEAVQPSGGTRSNTLFDAWHISFGVDKLAIAYRKLHGPTDPRRR